MPPTTPPETSLMPVLDKYEDFGVEVEVDAEDDVDADDVDIDVDVDVDVAEGGAVDSGPPGTCRNSVNYSAFALTQVGLALAAAVTLKPLS